MALKCGENKKRILLAAGDTGSSKAEALRKAQAKYDKQLKSARKELVRFLQQDCPDECSNKSTEGPKFMNKGCKATFDGNNWSADCTGTATAKVTCTKVIVDPEEGNLGTRK